MMADLNMIPQRDTQWLCPHCGTCNWHRIVACRKCGKPSGPEDYVYPARLPMEFKAAAKDTSLSRPCVDCGLITGCFCDYCKAHTRVPQEVWGMGQCTPLCTKCDATWKCCRFCRGVSACRPFAWRQGYDLVHPRVPGTPENFQASPMAPSANSRESRNSSE